MNCNASIYNDRNSLPLRDGMDLMDRMENDIKDSNTPEIVLDLGCGSGNLTVILSKRLKNVQHLYGVDIDEKMIEFAKQNNSGDQNNIQYFTQNFGVEWHDIRYELQSIEGRVGVIFTNHCLHWVYQQKANLFKNLSRLLAKNGRIYCCFLCIPTPLSNSEGMIASTIIYLMGIPTKQTQIEEWEAVFEKTGFALLKNEITQESYKFDQETIENFVIPNGFRIFEQFLGTVKFTIFDGIRKFIKIKPKTIFRETFDENTGKVMFETSYEKFLIILEK